VPARISSKETDWASQPDDDVLPGEESLSGGEPPLPTLPLALAAPLVSSLGDDEPDEDEPLVEEPFAEPLAEPPVAVPFADEPPVAVPFVDEPPVAFDDVPPDPDVFEPPVVPPDDFDDVPPSPLVASSSGASPLALPGAPSPDGAVPGVADTRHPTPKKTKEQSAQIPNHARTVSRMPPYRARGCAGCVVHVIRDLGSPRHGAASRGGAYMPSSSAGIVKYMVARHISLRVPQPGNTGSVSAEVS
jgi:hypothetical protein